MLDFSFAFTDADAAAGRLDKAVLARAPGSTRALVAACFAAGGVLAGERPARKSDRPAPGTRVDVAGLAETRDRAVEPEPDAALSVVWEDAHLVAFDKPAGQACHPVRPLERGTLAGAALARYPELAGVGGDPAIPGLLHRLDAGTSGLVLAARTQAAFDAVRAQIAAHAARKVYLALVEGAVEKAGGVSGHLAHADSFRGRMRPVSGGALPRGEKPMFAETFYRPLRRAGGFTLLEVAIFTGVTHQIRCQLASIGHPVAGDALYGARPLPASGAPGHRLHSLSMTFAHPATGRETTVRAPAPPWA
ncbi:MAG: RluA family pseudouridine synthase [Kiritimatiellae bacterium]|nr:RluA family pseudouridine synthase [Kiritimatiellia bacterium]